MTIKEAKDIVYGEFDVCVDSETIASAESYLGGYEQALLDVKAALTKDNKWGYHYRILSLRTWINEKLDKEFNNGL